MTPKASKALYYISLVSLIVLLFNIFYPRSYNVPHLRDRDNTRFWKLPSGSKIGYTLIQGKGNRKPYPLIYLHGGPGGHIADREIHTFAALADSGYDIYLYDQIGSGQSARLKNIQDYCVNRHLQDLYEIIKLINSHKVILIGQSWGSVLAALFAANHPDKIESIIFASPGPIFPMRQEFAKAPSPDSFNLKAPFYSNTQGNRFANNIRTKAMAFFATKFNIKLATDKEADDFATLLSYEVNKSTVCDTAKILKEDPGNGFYANLETYKSLLKVSDPRPRLQTIKVPVLVIKGQCDNQKWGFTNEYLQLFKKSQLTVIPNAGHFISVEQPQLFIETIRGFLLKVSLPPT